MGRKPIISDDDLILLLQDYKKVMKKRERIKKLRSEINSDEEELCEIYNISRAHLYNVTHCYAKRLYWLYKEGKIDETWINRNR